MIIEISLVDLIWRGIAGICAIVVFILILLEQKKTTHFLKEDLEKLEFEEDKLPEGELVRIEDVQDVIQPILRRFYNATDEDIEYIIQEIEQKAFLIK